MTNEFQETIKNITEIVFDAVLRILVNSNKRIVNNEQAMEIIGEEVVELLLGDRYEVERACLETDPTVILTIVARACVAKIKTENFSAV